MVEFWLPDKYCLIWALCLTVFQELIYLLFFNGPINRNEIRMAAIHGELRPENNYKINKKLNWLTVSRDVVLFPVGEESIFRGPIFILAHAGNTLFAVFGAIFAGILFGISHRNEISGTYADGTKYYYPWLECCYIAISGLMMGFVTIVTVSLWPAIIWHCLHNSLVVFLICNPRVLCVYNRISHILI